ncbi:uncharacterized protein CG4449 [Ceratina calcarata]|uniref:Uncharacterized protein CG4449 n=1 Tax=Ceratina calcarata TaxID=156304 RepID=A0AAJ7JF65_9HYME|nr:uncharacterized protein CG4449 [Ceratina calcarata]
MTSITIESSSSEDEDRIYPNPVARLKALRQERLLPQTNNNIGDKEIKETIERAPTETIETIELIETQKDQQDIAELITGVAMRTYALRSRKKIWRNNSQELDSDVEIVSAEDPQLDCSLTRENSMNKSFNEDENYEMSIKVLWRSKYVHYISICRNEECRKIFEHFATIERVPADDIIITNKSKTIKKNDTPASIGLSIIDILEGGIVKKTGTDSQNGAEEDIDEDTCVIKIQTGAKKKLNIRVKRDETFKSLLEKCSQELEVEELKIKLYFDGELISPTDTPDSLDIEDEACFDIRLPSQ